MSLIFFLNNSKFQTEAGIRKIAFGKNQNVNLNIPIGNIPICQDFQEGTKNNLFGEARLEYDVGENGEYSTTANINLCYVDKQDIPLLVKKSQINQSEGEYYSFCLPRIRGIDNYGSQFQKELSELKPEDFKFKIDGNNDDFRFYLNRYAVVKVLKTKTNFNQLPNLLETEFSLFLDQMWELYKNNIPYKSRDVLLRNKNDFKNFGIDFLKASLPEYAIVFEGINIRIENCFSEIDSNSGLNETKFTCLDRSTSSEIFNQNSDSKTSYIYPPFVNRDIRESGLWPRYNISRENELKTVLVDFNDLENEFSYGNNFLENLKLSFLQKLNDIVGFIAFSNLDPLYFIVDEERNVSLNSDLLNSLGGNCDLTGIATTSDLTTAVSTITGNIASNAVDTTNLAKEATLTNGTNGLGAIKSSVDSKPSLSQIESSAVLAKKTDIPGVSEIQSGLAKSSELTGLATSQNITDATNGLAKTTDIPSVSAIQSGLAKSSELTGLAAKSDLSPLAKTTDIPGVSEIQSGLAKSSELTGLAKEATLTSAQASIESKIDSIEFDKAGLATTSDLTTAVSTITGTITSNAVDTSDLAKEATVLELKGLIQDIEAGELNVNLDGVAQESTLRNASYGLPAIKAAVDSIEFDKTGLATTSDLTPLAKSSELTGLAAKSDLSPLAKTTDIPGVSEIQSGLAKSSELTGLAKEATLTSAQASIESKIDSIEFDKAGLATTSDLTTAVSTITGTITSNAVDTSDLAKEATVLELKGLIQDIEAGELNVNLDGVAQESTLRNASYGLPAIKAAVDSIEFDKTGLATTSDLTPLAKSSELTGLAAKSDLSPLAKTTDIPGVSEIQSGLAKSSELTGLAKEATLTSAQASIESKIDSIEFDKAGLATTSDLTTAVSTITGTITSNAVDTSDLAKEATVLELKGLIQDIEAGELNVNLDGVAQESTLRNASYGLPAIKAAVDSIEFDKTGLATTSDLVLLAKEATLTNGTNGLGAIKSSVDSKPSLSQIESSTVLAKKADIPGVSEIQSGLAKSSELTGLATSQNITDATNGLAKTTDIPSVSAIQSGLAKSSELTGLAKTSDLNILAKSDELNGLAKEATLTNGTNGLGAIKSSVDSKPSLSQIESSAVLAKKADIPGVSEIQSGLAKSSELTGLAAKSDLSPLAKTTDIPGVSEIQSGLAKSSELTGLAKEATLTSAQASIESKIDSIEFDKAGLATTSDLTTAVSTITGTITSNAVDTSDLAKEATVLELKGLIQDIEAGELNVNLDGVAQESTLRNASYGLPAIKAAVDSIEFDKTGLATTSDLTPLAKSSELTGLAAKSDLSPLAKTTDIPGVSEIQSGLAKSSELTGLAKEATLTSAQASIESKIDSIEFDKAGLATTSDLTTAVSTITGTITSNAVDTSDLAKEATVLELKGLIQDIEAGELNVNLDGVAQESTLRNASYGLPAIKAAVDSIEFDKTGLATTSDLTPLAKSSELTGLAAKSDLSPLAKTTDIPGVSEIQSGLAKSSELTGLAKEATLTSAQASIESKIDSIEFDKAGLATTSDLTPLAKSSELTSLAKENTSNSIKNKTDLIGLPADFSTADTLFGKIRNIAVSNLGNYQAGDPSLFSLIGRSTDTGSTSLFGKISGLAKSSELNGLAKEATLINATYGLPAIKAAVDSIEFDKTGLATTSDLTTAVSTITGAITSNAVDTSDLAKEATLTNGNNGLGVIKSETSLIKQKTDLIGLPSDLSNLNSLFGKINFLIEKINSLELSIAELNTKIEDYDRKMSEYACAQIKVIDEILK